MGLVAVLLQ